MNREWYQVAGNWLAGAAQNVGPTTGFGYGTRARERSCNVDNSNVDWRHHGRTVWSYWLPNIHYQGLDFTPPIILERKTLLQCSIIPKRRLACLDLYTGEDGILPQYNWTRIWSSGAYSTSRENLQWVTVVWSDI